MCSICNIAVKQALRESVSNIVANNSMSVGYANWIVYLKISIINNYSILRFDALLGIPMTNLLIWNLKKAVLGFLFFLPAGYCHLSIDILFIIWSWSRFALLMLFAVYLLPCLHNPFSFCNTCKYALVVISDVVTSAQSTKIKARHRFAKSVAKFRECQWVLDKVPAAGRSV